MSQMYEHATVSEGVTIKVLPSSTSKSRRKHMLLGSRVTLLGLFDPAVTQSLRSWSINQYVKGLREDPLQSRLMVGFGFGDESMEENVEQRDATNQDVFSMLASSVLGSQRMDRQQGINSLPAKRRSGEANLDLTLLPEGGDESICKEPGINDEWWEEKAGGQVSHVFEENTASLETQSEVQDNVTTIDMLHVQVHDDSTERGVEEKSETMESEKDAALAEKQRKAELRREKNRAAARRSNLRRRELRDAVRQKLNVERARIPRLLNRELALRRENLELRRAIAKKKESEET